MCLVQEYAEKLFEARFSKTSVDRLEQLSEDESPHVRKRVAYNRSTPVYILVKFIKDSSSEVRQMVAQNPNTPPAM